uniref:Uncharacterized protein n=1 Tax=Alexandrium monilatum TaxID=311494 RepID=A0A7S4SY65_9DINO
MAQALAVAAATCSSSRAANPPQRPTPLLLLQPPARTRSPAAMLGQAVRLAGRQTAVAAFAPRAAAALKPQVRAFGAGALTAHKPETAVARPFKGASRSEPEMEYVEEPSMLYMTFLLTTPFAFSFWFLTQYV